MNLGNPKWQMPGWRIEQRYSTGVLIGNWSEDRLGKVHRVTFKYRVHITVRRAVVSNIYAVIICMCRWEFDCNADYIPHVNICDCSTSLQSSHIKSTRIMGLQYTSIIVFFCHTHSFNVVTRLATALIVQTTSFMYLMRTSLMYL